MNNVLSIYSEYGTYIDSYYRHKNLSTHKNYFLGFFKKSVKYRILLKYDMDKVPKNSDIFSAKLRLNCVRNDYIGVTCKFYIHLITKKWNVQTVDYANQPSFDLSKKIQIEVDCLVGDYISIDITEYAKLWQAQPKSNFGIIIKSENEYSAESLLGIERDIELNIVWQLVKDEIIAKTDKKIAILTPQFYQFNGKRCLFGGGERYLIDLAMLLQKLGFCVDVFQPSTVGNWLKTYNKINIYGIDKGEVDKDFYVDLNKNFTNVTSDYDYHIYFNLDVMYPHVFPNSICISHGVWWDSTERDWWRSKAWYERMFKGLVDISLLVSVDTNTINWIHSVKPELTCKKIYVPNYVDLNIFKPDDVQNPGEYIKILYPRRLCSARGFNICVELAIELTKEYDNIIFSFVGRGGNEDSEKYMQALCKENPRIQYTWYEMDEMYKAYRGADIVLIPSLYSEGTSLSLLEAMACGKVIIAGLVGGLTDLILQGYNGYLIEVTKDNLKNTILQFINNPELMENMGKNARLVSEKFSKGIWEEAWKKIIFEQFL